MRLHYIRSIINGFEDGYTGSSHTGSFPSCANLWGRWISPGILHGGIWAYTLAIVRTIHRYLVPPEVDLPAEDFRCLVTHVD